MQPADPAAQGHGPLKPADLAAFQLIAIDWLPKFASPPSWQDWFAANGVATTTLRPLHQVHSLSSVAIQAAIDGPGFVLAHVRWSYTIWRRAGSRRCLLLRRLRYRHRIFLPSTKARSIVRSAAPSDHWLLERAKEATESISISWDFEPYS